MRTVGDRHGLPGQKLRVVDGRELDDADEVLALLSALDEDGVLELSDGNPRLEEELRSRGLHVEAQGHLRVGRKAFRPLVELTGMEPPAPMEAILTASVELGPEEIYLAHLPHYPAPLIPRLSSRPVQFEFAYRADRSALLWMRRSS